MNFLCVRCIPDLRVRQCALLSTATRLRLWRNVMFWLELMATANGLRRRDHEQKLCPHHTPLLPSCW